MKKPRILLYDLETSPNIGYSWGKWEQNIIEFKKEWELLSFAYKWHGQTSTKVVARPDFRDATDRSITKALWDLFDEADVLVAHNGNSFDAKKSRAKFIEHKLPPPSPSKLIDTKLIAKSQFSFNSNSLNDLGQLLKLGKKVPTGGFSLWLGCMAGDKKAWKKMKDYNKQDVNLLEKVYNRLRPWMQSGTNLAAYVGNKEACPSCASLATHHRGSIATATSLYTRLQCQDCGRWFKGKEKL